MSELIATSFLISIPGLISSVDFVIEIDMSPNFKNISPAVLFEFADILMVIKYCSPQKSGLL
jgi:hypothetical protein